ncbi:T9SS type A sorting domain-containing protein [Wenyingzhuangia sp. IMCC45533]
MCKKNTLVILLLMIVQFAVGQIMIPNNVFTHVAVRNGAWNRASTWDTNSVPRTGALVRIPNGITINYNANSNEHIFVIKNEGQFNINGNSNARKLIVDTFVNTPSSFLNIIANRNNSRDIGIELRPYNITAKTNNNNSLGERWKASTLNFFANGGENQPVFDHFGNRLPSDGSGVYGRYKWDLNQVSLCLMTMGKVRIIGKNKLDFSECSANVVEGTNRIRLKNAPTGWSVGDEIVLTGTNPNRFISRDEVFEITAINGSEIRVNKNTRFDHSGVTFDGTSYFPYVGNLTRNIKINSTFTETQTDLTKRGHTMFMFNGDIVIENALFKDLGRTDKSNILDDLKLGVPVISGNGSNRNIAFPNGNLNQFDNIRNVENQRGRYSLHFHKSLRGPNPNRLIVARGNVVWGSPGWGMVHHDSHANFTDNVVFDIEGGGMIAESGSETGIWRRNLVAGIKSDDTTEFLPGRPRFPNQIRRTVRDLLDDDFRGSIAYGMQGRAVRMVENVATTSGVAYNYQGTGQQTIVADKVNTSIFEAEGKVNPFPLRSEVVRTAVPLIEFRNNIAAACRDGFKSQGRSISGAFHRVASVVENMVAWNTNRFGIYISTNFGYVIKNSKFHQADNPPSAGSSNPLGNPSGILIQKWDDNINLNNVKFFNQTRIGAEVDARVGISANNDNSRFIFNRVSWLNSNGTNGENRLLGRRFDRDPNERTQIIETNLNPNTPFTVTFSKSNNMDDTIDFNGSLRFRIEGTVTDQAGNSTFANYAPKSTPTLFREYTFSNVNQARDYINANGGIRTQRGRQFFNFTEYMSDRITGQVTPVRIRIFVNNFSSRATIANNGLKKLDQTEVINVPVLSPNPASGSVFINVTENSTVSILDINGNMVKTSTVTPTNNQIDISNLSAGVYHVSILSKGDKQVKRLIVY